MIEAVQRIWNFSPDDKTFSTGIRYKDENTLVFRVGLISWSVCILNLGVSQRKGGRGGNILSSRFSELNSRWRVDTVHNIPPSSLAYIKVSFLLAINASMLVPLALELSNPKVAPFICSESVGGVKINPWTLCCLGNRYEWKWEEIVEEEDWQY